MTIPKSLQSMIKPLDHFLAARREPVPQQRQDQLRLIARAFGDELRSGPQVRFFKSVPLIRAPYPAHYAFLNARQWQTPFIHILNRMFIVQVDTPIGVKTLLLSPTWVDGSKETPYFARMSKNFGPFREIGSKLLAPVYNRVEDAVAETGLRREDIDFISFDHMHTQDVRRWLGGEGFEQAYFPNAKLLIMREEWDACRGLIAPQKDWYISRGIAGVNPDKVVILDQDVLVGEGLALIKTPGHTLGNHSFAVNTPDGVYVISENGVGPDSYAPQHSNIPGFREFHDTTGMEVVLNGNTLEAGLEQYISMIVEKEIAGPSRKNPLFPNLFNSSEFTHYWLFPGQRPTINVGDKTFGTLMRGQRKQAAA